MIVEVGNSDDRVIMTHELRIAHLRIAPQEGNCEVHLLVSLLFNNLTQKERRWHCLFDC